MDAYDPSQISRKPSISVVVPSFNQGPFIRETLESLFAQAYPELEVIVVDGGSTDGTLGVLQDYGDRIRWVSESDDGQADAIRKGFSMARGEWLTWLNSDDLQTDNALHRVADCIAQHPKSEVVAGRGHYVAEDGTYLRPYPTIRIQGQSVNVQDELFEKGYVAQPSVFYRKDAYERVGGVDATLRYVMDYDLWVRFARAGCSFAFIDADISANRWHDGAKTASQPLALLAEFIATQRRHYGAVSAYAVQAVSDLLFSLLHAPHRPGPSLGPRMLYFKAMWVVFNGHRPWHCLKGLLTTHLCPKGPITGDRLTNRMLIGRARRNVASMLSRPFTRSFPWLTTRPRWRSSDCARS